MGKSVARVPQQRLHNHAPVPEELTNTRSRTGFLALIRSFFSSGVAARSEEPSRLLDERHVVAQLSLARLLANSQSFVFESRHALWIPMFQLDPRKLLPRPSVHAVHAEQAPVLSGWQLAT